MQPKDLDVQSNELEELTVTHEGDEIDAYIEKTFGR
jgi:hypothetical protein